MSRVPCPRQRVTVGGYRYSHRPRQARITQQLYDETGPDGKRRYTVAQIAAEFGVTRPTIYRHLVRLAST